MLSDALVLSVLSSLGLMFAFNRLPEKVKKFLIDHPLFTDIMTFLVTYLTLGSTLTALTAGAMVAIITSVGMYVQAHPEDFLYLRDLKVFLAKQLQELKIALNEYGTQYREKVESRVQPVDANL